MFFGAGIQPNSNSSNPGWVSGINPDLTSALIITCLDLVLLPATAIVTFLPATSTLQFLEPDAVQVAYIPVTSSLSYQLATQEITFINVSSEVIINAIGSCSTP